MRVPPRPLGATWRPDGRVMDDYWDSEDQWVDEPECIVCKGYSLTLVCSGSCQDVMMLRNRETYA